jgi:hypothetical protein
MGKQTLADLSQNPDVEVKSAAPLAADLTPPSPPPFARADLT